MTRWFVRFGQTPTFAFLSAFFVDDAWDRFWLIVIVAVLTAWAGTAGYSAGWDERGESIRKIAERMEAVFRRHDKGAA